MIDTLTAEISRFLSCHYDSTRPILLALSGGPDSLALFHLLLDYKKSNPINFAIAHVDHKWRPESTHEAELLASMAKKYGHVFHLKTLNNGQMKGNLEAICREERLCFFAALCKDNDYQAVLLGHHADDLAETVLKRTLEGAALPYLCGIRPETEMMGMKLWRPLLPFSKVQITEWLDRHGLKGFEDKTNLDPKFMRGRLRSTILPMLSSEFGKEIRGSLCRIGRESGELRDYLNSQFAPYLAKVVQGKMGQLLDLNAVCPSTRFEIKYLIRKLCEIDKFSLSHASLETAATLLLQGKANKTIKIGPHILIIDRKRLFVCSSTLLPLPKLRFFIGESEEPKEYGSWEIKVSNNIPFNGSCTGWQALWKGGGEIILPQGKYEISFPELRASYPRSLSLAKWWTDHKVPAFLRTNTPIIYQNNCVCHEFLTGKIKNKEQNNEKRWMKVTIQLI